ncbi:hypothetical protein B0H13DRAFT_2364614 [Mycena leptocephala]|nr:hypothetical protein B0H13DRAFT_2364614 [Mycena leptocephala]
MASEQLHCSFATEPRRLFLPLHNNPPGFLLSPLFPPFLRPEVCYLALRWRLSLLFASGLQIHPLVGALTA